MGPTSEDIRVGRIPQLMSSRQLKHPTLLKRPSSSLGQRKHRLTSTFLLMHQLHLPAPPRTQLQIFREQDVESGIYAPLLHHPRQRQEH